MNPCFLVGWQHHHRPDQVFPPLTSESTRVRDEPKRGDTSCTAPGRRLCRRLRVARTPDRDLVQRPNYPFVDNPPGAEWTKTLPLCAEDREKLLNGNARRLLKV